MKLTDNIVHQASETLGDSTLLLCSPIPLQFKTPKSNISIDVISFCILTIFYGHCKVSELEGRIRWFVRLLVLLREINAVFRYLIKVTFLFITYTVSLQITRQNIFYEVFRDPSEFPNRLFL